MRRQVFQRHIWGYSVCQCPIKRIPGLYGLKYFSVKFCAFVSFFSFMFVTVFGDGFSKTVIACILLQYSLLSGCFIYYRWVLSWCCTLQFCFRLLY